MPEIMKAAIVRTFGAPLTIEELPVPTPGRGQVLVRVAACGVCHTDLHIVNNDWPISPVLPLIAGHEGTGTIVEVGAGVHIFKGGERVGVPWLYSACGGCECCVTGWETLCPSVQNTGYAVNGCFAEYVVAEASYVSPLPDQLGFFEAAPLLCAGVTVYRGLKETGARAGEWVVISGVGGLGHLAVQYAKAMGFYVAAVDVSADKLELAHFCGVDVTVNAATETDPVATILRATDGGAHGVLITAPALSAFTQGVQMTRRRGTAVVVALPTGEFTAPLFDVVTKGITIRGSFGGTRQDLREALHFAAEGKVHADIQRLPMDCVNEVFRLLREGKVDGRMVLDIGGVFKTPETTPRIRTRGRHRV